MEDRSTQNGQGFWHVSVYEVSAGKIEGFLISSGHPAFNMLGPGVARTEAQAAALIYKELDQYRGRSPVTLVPMEKTALVRQMYEWGARNVELHFCQVRASICLPSSPRPAKKSQRSPSV